MCGRTVFEVKGGRMVKEQDFKAEKKIKLNTKPQKRPFQRFGKQPQINGFLQKIDGRYESWVEIALKPDDLSSAGCGRIAISSHKFGSYKKPFISFNG